MRRTVALVSGGSGAIGAAIVSLLAQASVHVVFSYHSHKAQALALAAQCAAQGGDALALPCDVRITGECDALVCETVRRYGHIDWLINNAGAAHFSLLQDMSDAAFEDVLSINLTGPFRLCRAALPHMIAQKRGSIVNVSSIWGITGASCEAAYSAAKAGLIGLTRALAQEVAPSGIRVNCVAPGVIDTPMNAALTPPALDALREATPMARLGTPLEVAQCVLFLAGEQSSFCTGQVLSPNGGLVL